MCKAEMINVMQPITGIQGFVGKTWVLYNIQLECHQLKIC